MSECDFSPLPSPCFRFLTDRMYEKRKQASIEIEKMVKVFNQSGESTQIRKLLKVLGQDLSNSQNPNWRKGGSIGLAAMAVALGKDSSNYSVELVQPIISSLRDQDSRVRFYACEALHTVVKVIRSDILPLFPTIFDIMSDLTADSDQSVKTAAEMIDRLLKDIICESPEFDVSTFISLLRERLYTNKPLTQRFVISWVQFLNDLPFVDTLSYLPDLLEGLFKILSGPTPEIRQMTESVLSEFKGKILANPSKVDLSLMVNPLVHHSESKVPLVQLIAITWLKEFVNISQDANKSKLLSNTASLLSAILPCLDSKSIDPSIDPSHASHMNIIEVAKALNHSLMQLVTREERAAEDGPLDFSRIVEVLNRELRRSENSSVIKLAVLRWIHHLHANVPVKVNQHIEEIFPALIKTLVDPAEEITILDLEVLASVTSSTGDVTASSNDFFTKFITELLNLFYQNSTLLDDRGSFIIRQLCYQTNAEHIYISFSEILQTHTDLQFVHHMVQILNRILFSASELHDLRMLLKDLKTDQSCNLFVKLYQSWCHNVVATISLCLLTKNYHHAFCLVTMCEDINVTLEFLTELDQLVQLIESPIFAFLRLQLLEPQKNADLVKCLYGILMLLPQGSSFLALARRLECIPRIQLSPSPILSLTTDLAK